MSRVTGEVNYASNLASSNGANQQPSNWPALGLAVVGSSGTALYPTGVGVSPIFGSNHTSPGGVRVVPAPNMLSTLHGRLPVYDPTRKKWVHYLAPASSDGLSQQSQVVAPGQPQAGTANVPPAPVRPVTRVVAVIPQSQPAAPLYSIQQSAPAPVAVAIPTVIPLPAASEAAAEGVLQPRGATLLSRNSGSSSSENSQVSAPAFEPGRTSSVKLPPASPVVAPASVVNPRPALSLSNLATPPVPPVPTPPLPPLVSPVPIAIASGRSAELPKASESDSENENGVNQSQSQSQILAIPVQPQQQQTTATSGLATSFSSSPVPARAASYSVPVIPPAPPELGVNQPRPRLELSEGGLGGNLLPNPVSVPVPVPQSFFGIAGQGSEQASRTDPVQVSPNLAQLQLELPALPNFTTISGTGGPSFSLPLPLPAVSPPPGVNGTPGK